MGLLVDHDQVDVVLAAQAVVHDRQRRVGVRRQPHADDPRRERQHRVDQPRTLVREAVVVVAPARRGEQHVQRRHRRPPRQLLGVLQPLHVLHRHRGRDHRERLVRREDAVPARQGVPLQPALAQVLAEHLHHPAVGTEVVVGLEHRAHERPVGHLEHRLQPVARRLVGREQPERVAWRRTGRASAPPTTPCCRPATARAPRTPLRTAPARPAAAASRSPPFAYGVADIRLSPAGASALSSGTSRPDSSNSVSGEYDRSHSSSIRRCSGFSVRPDSGTWCARKVPCTWTPSTTSGPVQPFGVRRMIAGHPASTSRAPDPPRARRSTRRTAPGTPHAGRHPRRRRGPSPGCAGTPSTSSSEVRPRTVGPAIL